MHTLGYDYTRRDIDRVPFIPDEELEHDVKRVAKELGHTPTSGEYQEHGEFSPSPIKTRFGNGDWGEAMNKIGFEYNPSLKQINDETLKSSVKRVTRMTGSPPTGRVFNRHSEFSTRTVAKRFGDGSWVAALNNLGYDYEPYENRLIFDRIPSHELEADVERVNQLSDRTPPTSSDYLRYGDYSPQAVNARFGDGSWIDAMANLGYDVEGLEPKNTPVTTQELKTDIHRVSKELGYPPSSPEYSEHGNHSTTTIVERFGEESWGETMEYLGYDYEAAHEHPWRKISNDELKTDVERVVNKLGHTPNITEYRSHGEYSPATVAQRFADNSWGDAMRELGYDYTSEDPGKKPERSKDALIADIERVVEDLGHVPNSREYDELGEGSVTEVRRRLGRGSWTQAMNALGYDYTPATVVTKEQVVTDIYQLINELGRVPGYIEYDELGSHNTETALNVFEMSSWSDVLNSLGYDYDAHEQQRVDVADLKEDVHRVVEKLGHVPTGAEYNTHGEFSDSTVVNHIGDGSWVTAMNNLGYEDYSRTIGLDNVASDVEMVVEMLGHVPSSVQYETHGTYSSYTVVRTVDVESWADALNDLGYEYEPRQTQRRDVEALKADVKRVVEKIGKPPTVQEYEKHGKYSYRTVADRFGDGAWPAAMYELGYDEYHPRETVSRNQLIADIERVTAEIGRPPSTQEYAEHGTHSTGTVLAKLDGDSWESALTSLGYDYDSNRDKYADCDDIVRDIHRVIEELGELPTTVEYEDRGEYSLQTVYNHVGNGSWPTVMSELGYEYDSEEKHKQVTDKELADDIERLVNELGSVPTTHEYRDHGEYNYRTVAERFGDGSWPTAMRELGYDY